MKNKVNYLLVNSFEDLEGLETILGLSQGYPTLAIDPVFTPESLMGNGDTVPIVIRAWKEDSELWLDTQPPIFILYVSFGSMLGPSKLDFGLKESKQPFLWALRLDVADNMFVILLEGFVEGIRERGIIMEWTS
eukprot:Gb_00330 [translate_table: standard]